MTFEDNFTLFLKSLFTPGQYAKATLDYFITSSNLFWKKSTVFWQINDKEQIQAGKVMLYDPETGKRTQNPFTHVNWDIIQITI